MRNPFKSKYYFRILDKIAELEDKKDDAARWLKEHGKDSKYWPYYEFKHRKCNETIQMLRAPVMTDIELIQHTVRLTLQLLGYAPKAGRRYLSQNEALKMLKPVKIGRARLQRLIRTGQVSMKDKENFDIRNSRIRLYAEDIYKLINN